MNGREFKAQAAADERGRFGGRAREAAASVARPVFIDQALIRAIAGRDLGRGVVELDTVTLDRGRFRLVIRMAGGSNARIVAKSSRKLAAQCRALLQEARQTLPPLGANGFLSPVLRPCDCCGSAAVLGFYELVPISKALVPIHFT